MRRGLQKNYYLILVGVLIRRIENPKHYFNNEGSQKLEEVVTVVRAAFGKEGMDYQDIYLHATMPEIVFLAEEQNRVLAMASYTSTILSGIPSLIVEGVAITPHAQGKRIFAQLTDEARSGEPAVCLRTQNPRMYKALQNYCVVTYPERSKVPPAIVNLRSALAEHLGCASDEKGIIRKYYGGLFYGEEPTHPQATSFFKKELGLHLEDGDAVLCVGFGRSQ